MTPTPFTTAPCRAAPSRTVWRGVLAIGVAALLCACGGGDEVAAPQATNSDLLVSIPFVGAALHAGGEVHFGGGICAGGNGIYTTTWTFGDGPTSTSSGVHTYLAAGRYQVRVECRDTTGASVATWDFFDVQL